MSHRTPPPHAHTLSHAGTIAATAGAAAGTPPRAGRRARRGSVLVLILGGLALLSVVAVIYVTVGQSDRRTGATTRARDSVADTAQGVAIYLGGVIGDDALATFVDGTDPQLLNIYDPTQPGPVLLREAHDYASTDFTVETSESITLPARPHRRFNPAGSYDRIWAESTPDLRTPTDPWLAASEPTWLLGPSGSGSQRAPGRSAV